MKNTTHIMNARIWKRAAGGPYKKTESEKYLKDLLQQYPFQGFTEERLSESFYPTCLCQSQDLVIGDTGMSLLLQGLLLPLVAHQNYKFE